MSVATTLRAALPGEAPAGFGEHTRAAPRGVLILANPYSGVLSNRAHVAELGSALASQGLRPRPVWQLEELDALATQSDLAEEYRCLVAAGGDGTLNRAINHQLRVPLAVFPLGNENLFARHFAFTNNPQRLAEAIARGKLRPIDLGRSAGRLFSIVASGGFDGEVARRLAQWREQHTHLRRVGHHSYIRPILASLTEYQFPPMEIEIDDRPPIEGALAMVFNIPTYALGLQLCPDATADDGHLDWIVFKRPGLWHLGRYALATLLRQQRRLGDVFWGRARRVRLRCTTPVPLEIDGDQAGFAPLEIEVMPAATQVVVM